MPTPDSPSKNIRGVLLEVIAEQQPSDPLSNPYSIGNALGVAMERLGIPRELRSEQALLAQVHDLFRTGYLAWGYDFQRNGPPFFHVSEQGRELLKQLSHDPGNPAGYLNHVNAVAKIGDIGQSYLKEAIECFVAGLYKAAAVMVGCTAEAAVLELRDALVNKYDELGKSVPKGLKHWQIKTVLDQLHADLTREKPGFPKKLQEEFGANWSPFTHQIRRVRNDAGHPVSVQPVSYDSIYGSLLILPELLKLQNQLMTWITTDLK